MLDSSVFLSTLTPKFYVALTGTSSLISGLILIFEWWYFRKFGTSFIEQVSLHHISPWLGCSEPPAIEEEPTPTKEQKQNSSAVESKAWINPLSLFRGAEYQRVSKIKKKDPLTFHDMNLSAQEDQTKLNCDLETKPEFEFMQAAWRERHPELRIKGARSALEVNKECVTAQILLAEEECTTILEVEAMFKSALKYAEANLKKSQPTSHLSSNSEHHKKIANVVVYIKRRLAMCARKLGKLKEATKMFRDLTKETAPFMEELNIHENLLEVLLESGSYADCQAVLSKYDDHTLPKSATICYTSALLKARTVADKFSLDSASRKGLTPSELSAVEAIHRAVEFNPHVTKYLLEMKPLILPPEHIIRRGDSEAIAYAFGHIHHWKRVDGALNLLQCTWEGTFRMIPYPLEKGYLFYPYPPATDTTDRELLPSFHEVSVYPKKDLPFFIIFTGGLCCVTALLALLTHQYPELMGTLAKMLVNWWYLPLCWIMEKVEAVFPLNIVQYVTRV